MERYGDDHVGIRYQTFSSLRQPPTEQLARIVAVVKLEIVDQLAHHSVVARYSAGAGI